MVTWEGPATLRLCDSAGNLPNEANDPIWAKRDSPGWSHELNTDDENYETKPFS